MRSEKEFLEDIGILPNEKSVVTIERIKRYQNVVKNLKARYKNQCQIEGCHYTFTQKNGERYSEAHHLKPLSEDGSQDEMNVIILCPNHHRMMHYASINISDIIGNRREIDINGSKSSITYK